MKKIAFFTTTRAEFGLLSGLISAVDKEETLDHLLFVGGTHLSKKYGYTIDEIKEHNFIITDTFDFISNEDNSFSLLESAGRELTQLAHIFDRYDFDAICVLGDRIELLPIVNAAIIYKKVIIHIHGGEKTEGAVDEQVRHMITKSAHLHFAICERYRENIINMGEHKERVFNTGALGLDNMINVERISKDEIFATLKLDASKQTVLLTYHPVTLEFSISVVEQVRALFDSLEGRNFQIVITAPNIDENRELIFQELMKYINSNEHYFYFESLGIVNYLSLIPHCEFVIGNSSSGIIEVPYFKVPTINIGDRQKGRICHDSVITTDYSCESIKQAIDKAVSESFKLSIKDMSYLFGEGNSAGNMVEIIKNVQFNQALLRKKLCDRGE